MLIKLVVWVVFQYSMYAIMMCEHRHNASVLNDDYNLKQTLKVNIRRKDKLQALAIAITSRYVFTKSLRFSCSALRWLLVILS